MTSSFVLMILSKALNITLFKESATANTGLAALLAGARRRRAAAPGQGCYTLEYLCAGKRISVLHAETLCEMLLCFKKKNQTQKKALLFLLFFLFKIRYKAPSRQPSPGKDKFYLGCS